MARRLSSRVFSFVRFGTFFVLALVAITLGGRLMGTASAQARPAPTLEPNLGWLNTDRPLDFENELKGHVVLLDFFTYCCINCYHLQDDLRYLQDKYGNRPFVVIGVHSAKFETEGSRESVRNAIHRYGIEHPVVVDDEMQIWRKYGVRAWPSVALIGADGEVIGTLSGEGNRDVLDYNIARALTEANRAGTLAEERVSITPDAQVAAASALSFPAKAEPFMLDGRDLLAVADTSNHRVIITTAPDAKGRSEVVREIGTAAAGHADGPANLAQFNDPRGLAFDAERRVLYLADTRNHRVRTIDVDSWDVGTLAGTGERGFDRVGGGVGTDQPLASPWDLHLSPDGDQLWIAMAGTHQLWTVDLETREATAIVGSGKENSFDAPIDVAMLAQPSGLALSSDQSRLYFADSESSSVRAWDLASDETLTVVGFNVPTPLTNGLSEFGDVDGAYPDARLQHPLGVAVIAGDGGDRLFVADTYNDKIKLVDPVARTSTTFAGVPRGSAAPDGTLRLNEPGGIETLATGELLIADTNNHRLVVLDPDDASWREVAIAGLMSPGRPMTPPVDALDATIALGEAGVTLTLDATLPEGAKANREFPAQARIKLLNDGRTTAVLAQTTVRNGELPVAIDLPMAGLSEGSTVLVELSFGYCFDDESVCLPGELAWVATVRAGEGAAVLTGPVAR